MGQGILLSADQEVDFMVHGVFSYKWFGHTVWITTTHVCVLIVFLILGIFALCANRAMSMQVMCRQASRMLWRSLWKCWTIW